MRLYNNDFLVLNEAPEKEPRYMVEISFDSVNADTIILTSHHDVDTPIGATVIYGVLNNISGTSQEVDPIKANSTIGDLNFSAADIVSALTSTIYAKLYPTVDAVADGLRGKRAQLSVGFKGLLYDKYEIPSGGTQVIDGIDYDMNSDSYYFQCSDVQRTIRKTICDVKTTTLRNTVDNVQKAIALADVSELVSVVHGDSFSDSPNDTVGYIDIDGESIAWRQKLEVAITASGADLSFSANTITSTSTDLSVFSDKQQIIFSSGTSINAGTFTVVGTPTTNSLVVVESLVTEVAGVLYIFKAEIQVYDCTRGVLNTRASAHIVPDSTPLIRRPEVREVIYLELPAVKALYAFLTGSIYGTANSLPAHWHLNIGPSFIQTSTFTTIGNDWWDLDSDLVGVPSNFQYLEKIDGKEFVERELLLLLGAFMPVTSQGELSLRRMTYVGAASAYSVLLDETNVVAVSRLKHDYRSVYNQFLLRWNWDPIREKFTRNELVMDSTSISAHGLAEIFELPFKGMHGATYTTVRAHIRRDSAMDRYVGPPERITVICSPKMNKIEIGDVVRLKLKNLKDFVSGGSIARSFEVQRVAIDWLTGRVALTLFGSTQRPEPLPTLASSTVVPDGDYITKGVDISTVTSGINSSGTWVINANSFLYGAGTMGTIEYTAGTVSATNGSKVVTGASTVWASLSNTNIDIGGAAYRIATIDSDTQITLRDNFLGTTGSGISYKLHGAIYYWNGDIRLDSIKDLKVFDNVRIRYKGVFTINGKIDGKGNGLAGGAVGIPGYIGNTKAEGGIESVAVGGLPINCFDSEILLGKNASLPSLLVEYDGTSVIGLDALDMRPTSGGIGGDFIDGEWPAGNPLNSNQAGGQGANGASALVLDGRGVSMGASASIDLGGGVSPETVLTHNHYGFRAGHGAGGHGGPLLVILDGSAASTSGVFTKFTAVSNDTPISVPALLSPNYPSVSSVWYELGSPSTSWAARSYYTGFAAQESKDSLYREITLADYAAPVIDTPDETSLPAAVVLAQAAVIKTTLNFTAIEISVTPPAGTGPAIDNYKGSKVSARLVGTESWLDIGEVGKTGELVAQVLADGAEWEIKAHPISTKGFISEDFITAKITVTGAIATIIGAGNSIVTGNDPATNGGVVVDENGIDLYDATGQKVFDAGANDGTIIMGVVSTEKFVKFDTITGDLTLGLSTKLRGAEAYNNDSISLHELFYSLDSWGVGGSGTYGATISGQGGLFMSTDGSAAASSFARRGFRATITNRTWDKDKLWKCPIQIGGVTASTTMVLGMGLSATPTSTADKKLAFKIVDRTLWALSCAGLSTGVTLTDTGITIVDDTTYVLEIIFTAGVEARFYIDGALKATHTTQLPSGLESGSIASLSYMISKDASTLSENAFLRTSELKSIQSE